MEPTVLLQADGSERPDQRDPVAVWRGPDGRLRARVGEREATVEVRRCFPWSEANRYLSLRTDDQEELVLVRDLAELSPASRDALALAMGEAGFMFEVTAVVSVEEEVEIRHWTVETRQGGRTFQTRLDDWPRALPGGGFLIRDVAGDLFRLPSPAGMDARSRKLLWAFVD